MSATCQSPHCSQEVPHDVAYCNYCNTCKSEIKREEVEEYNGTKMTIEEMVDKDMKSFIGIHGEQFQEKVEVIKEVENGVYAVIKDSEDYPDAKFYNNEAKVVIDPKEEIIKELEEDLAMIVECAEKKGRHDEMGRKKRSDRQRSNIDKWKNKIVELVKNNL